MSETPSTPPAASEVEPFVDTPVKAAIRRAFDRPTLQNLDTLVWIATEELLALNESLASTLRAVEAERDAMRAGIKVAMENLGVPGAGYPAPVAVAFEALAQCLPAATNVSERAYDLQSSAEMQVPVDDAAAATPDTPGE